MCTDLGEMNPMFLKATCVSWWSECNVFSLQLRAFTDSRDDMALGHVVVLLQHEWPRGENLFLKAINKICQQGNFQYENFFNYVTSILSLTKNVFHMLYCSVEKAVSFNSSSFPKSYCIYFHTMKASCSRLSTQRTVTMPPVTCPGTWEYP